MNSKKRCKWCNLNNPLYVDYHDNEWCVPVYDDEILLEFMILEPFQAGLSWECILNKREAFRKAFDNYDKNKIITYDEEWCRLNLDEHYLYEMLILESFQAGLSWECVLNKRENFRIAYDRFDIDKVCSYDESKIEELQNNPGIIRNKLKIKASINNSKIYREIVGEYGSFAAYLNTFTKGQIIYETGVVKNRLSDEISKDLQKRGMKFVGSIIIYSYLQAIGIIGSHEKDCFLHQS